jgi:hypothetical protein
MRRASRCWARLLVAGVCMVGLPLVVWALTQHVNAWKGRAPTYAGYHRGSLVLLSSIWDHPPRGPDGRRLPWAYDVIGMKVDNGRGPWPRGAFRHFRAQNAGPAWWPPVRRIGTRYSLGAGPWNAPMWMVELPIWLLALPGGVLAVISHRRWRRAIRAESGLCRRCGYDLSATAPGQPCPECGANRPAYQPLAPP